jgi:hypothetical protein
MIPQGYNLSFRQLSGCIRPGRGVGVLISAPDLDSSPLSVRYATSCTVCTAFFSFPRPVRHICFYLLSSGIICHACPSLIFSFSPAPAGSFTLLRITCGGLFISFYFTYFVVGMQGFYLLWGFLGNIRACGLRPLWGIFVWLAGIPHLGLLGRTRQHSISLVREAGSKLEILLVGVARLLSGVLYPLSTCFDWHGKE